MRFGFCAAPENLPALTRAGFDYIEPAVAPLLLPEQPEAEVMPPLWALLAASPLKAEAFNVLLPGDLRVAGEGTDISRQERYLEAAFGRAAALGGQVVVFGSGAARTVPDGFPAEAAYAQLVAFVRLAGDAAARHGMVLVIEPLNRGECNIITSVGEGTRLALDAAHPSVAVLSDLYHVATDGQTYDETRAAGPLLRHVHVAGAEGRRAPVAADREFLTGYFRALKETGYDARVSVEAKCDDIPGQAAAILEVLHKAWDAA